MKKTKSLYQGHRFPSSVISCAVRWYFRFNLSLHDIEELLLERGVVVTYKAIRCTHPQTESNGLAMFAWCNELALDADGRNAKSFNADETCIVDAQPVIEPVFQYFMK